MGLSADMLSVVKLSKPPGPTPNGLKVTTLADPKTLTMASSTPTLAIGGFIIWPMSYMDNRVSFGMVSYDPKGRVVEQLETPGARYVYKVTVDKASGTATFWGQDDQKVSLTLDQMYKLILTA
ncbi:MAG TPA: hypothetical protein VHU41_16925 [Thermoanaerobaculia bacterium]|jgi:hypothetical protein|nr:hypothetical protein [Thermoanaerobaculia bacterium]